MRLPVTGILKLESQEAQWRILTRGLINKLETTALIEIETDRTIRIKLVIKKIFSPEQINCQARSFFVTDLEKRVNNGLAQIDEFFSGLLMKSQWIFAGYIDNREDAPILIIHYSLINITIYTQKLNSENVSDLSSIAGLN